ncbi:MAG: glycosyltransferase family 92 protein [Myxococcota bacterium]|jgi:hypothetical protein|nr:glycosyltransferase family 92 protein [Myxococcota bacterium]
MKHRLTIAAIFKHENPYLREWIEYHRMVGFDHFYLYDNDGGEDAQSILQPYVELGIVTRHPWLHFDGSKHDRPTHFFGQDKNHLAFGHAARNYRSQFEWILKIDIDEFLVPLEGEDLRPIIARYTEDPRIRGIRIPRIDFGFSGHRDRPPGLVIESYTQREAENSDHKDLARGAYLTNNAYSNSAHSWHYRLLSLGRTVKESDVSDMRVNHYYTKSLEECLLRQNMMQTRPVSEEQFNRQNDGLNVSSDNSMLRFLPELKKRLSAPPR